MNNFKKQKQYSSCKCMYITKMQCTDEVLKNYVILRLNLYLHLYHVQKFVLVTCLAICYENKILFLFRQCPTGNYGRLSRPDRHTSLAVAACLVRISSEVGHSHPWPRQGHCMPKTSVKICVCRLNIQEHMAKKRTYKAWTN